jgi:hypothetical protein
MGGVGRPGTKKVRKPSVKDVDQGLTTMVSGTVVPSGTLKATKHHPLASLIPEERERLAMRCLGELVLRVMRRPC